MMKGTSGKEEKLLKGVKRGPVQAKRISQDKVLQSPLKGLRPSAGQKNDKLN